MLKRLLIHSLDDPDQPVIHCSVVPNKFGSIRFIGIDQFLNESHDRPSRSIHQPVYNCSFMSISSKKPLSAICPIMPCFLRCLPGWFRGWFRVHDIHSVHVMVSVGQILLYQPSLIVLFSGREVFRATFHRAQYVSQAYVFFSSSCLSKLKSLQNWINWTS